MRKRWASLSVQVQEDVVSYAVQCWLMGRSLHTDFTYLIIDYLRKHEGGYGDRRGEDALGHAVSLEAITRDGTALDPPAMPKGPMRIPETYLDGLRPYERMLIKLFYEWEFTQAEIGDLFGWTADNVGHHMMRVKGRIKRTKVDSRGSAD